jgi:hypothetical protein
MPAETDTLRLSTLPCIGIFGQFVAGLARQAAHAVALGAEHPGAGTLLVDGIEFGFSASPAAPITQMPRSCISRKLRARLVTTM